MFRMIKGFISFIFTIIVIAVILYVFKFNIKNDSLCISFRHKEHQTQLEKATKNLKKSVNDEKNKLGNKIVHSIMGTTDKIKNNSKKNLKKNKEDDEITIEKIIRKNENK